MKIFGDIPLDLATFEAKLKKIAKAKPVKRL
jgi:hypothetical protein